MEDSLPQNSQKGGYVFLDEDVFHRWSSIRVAEGVATDSEVAGILIRGYDKSQGTQALESAVCCGQCNSQLSLLCEKCQPQSLGAQSSDDAEDTDDSPPPMVYRLLHVTSTEDDDGISDSDSLSPLASRRDRACNTCTDDPVIVATAKDVASAAKSVIIVDYINESKKDVPHMCPEGSIFAAVQNSDSFANDNNVRVSLEVKPASPQYHNLQTVVPADECQYIQDEAVGHQLDQIGDVVTVSQATDSDQLLQQLLYGDTATQTFHRPDSEAASAAAALEALSSDLQFVPQPTAVTVKPRRGRGGKPIPPNRIRICRMCGRQCASPSDLKRHMMLHTGEKPFACDECGASFVQRGNWKRHKIEMHGSKNHLCPQCGVRFALVEDLQHHMRFHNSDRQHTCALCKSAFKSAHNLRKHMKIHTNNRPFQCTECGTSFATKQKLTMHRTTHTGEKLYRCTTCQATFLEAKALKQHKQTHKETAKKSKLEEEQFVFIVPRRTSL